MFDEDGYLDPFLKVLVVGFVGLGLARMLWGWLTGDFTDWITGGVWGWITSHIWWMVAFLGLGVLGTFLLARVFFGPSPEGSYDSWPYHPDPPQPWGLGDVTLTFRMGQLAAMTPDGFEQACADLLARDGFSRPRRVGGRVILGSMSRPGTGQG